MSVNAEVLGTLRSAVDETHAVLLSRRELEVRKTGIGLARGARCDEGAVVVHLSVDQVVVRRAGSNDRLKIGAHDLLHNIVVVAVVPVLKENRADVDVIVLFFREGSVDDHRSKQASVVLSTVMSVPPRSTVEISLEPVGECFPRCDGALLWLC